VEPIGDHDHAGAVVVYALFELSCERFGLESGATATVDPERIDRIFEVFKRLHNDDEYSGTGIGLSLCQEAVDDHGGDIWIEPEPEEGSTVFFTLPKRQ
jgi:light-regulated signal transduction histidine kinase (bacteriophytochrome)